MDHNVFIFVMVSYVLPFLPVSMVILELVVQDQSFYARLCRVRPRRARPGRLVWTGLYSSWQARENIFLHKKVSIYKVYWML